jgi:hypothetical protein
VIAYALLAPWAVSGSSATTRSVTPRGKTPGWLGLPGRARRHERAAPSPPAGGAARRGRDAASGLIGPPRESRCARARPRGACADISAAPNVGSPMRLLARRLDPLAARTQRRSLSSPRSNRSAKRRQRDAADQADSTATTAYRTLVESGGGPSVCRASRSRYTGCVPLTRYRRVRGKRCVCA